MGVIIHRWRYKLNWEYFQTSPLSSANLEKRLQTSIKTRLYYKNLINSSIHLGAAERQKRFVFLANTSHARSTPHSSSIAAGCALRPARGTEKQSVADRSQASYTWTEIRHRKQKRHSCLGTIPWKEVERNRFFSTVPSAVEYKMAAGRSSDHIFRRLYSEGHPWIT